MILTDQEYKQARAKLKELDEQIEAQAAAFRGMGLTEEQVKRGIAPLSCFREQLHHKIETYRCLKRGKISPAYTLSDLGRFLIKARIANRMSQRELASKLGVSRVEVARYEKNEYHAIDNLFAHQLCEALGVKITIEVAKPGTAGLDHQKQNLRGNEKKFQRIDPEPPQKVTPQVLRQLRKAKKCKVAARFIAESLEIYGLAGKPAQIRVPIFARQMISDDEPQK